MRPIRLAIIFDQQIRSGGGYQQALNAAIAARRLSADLVDIVFFTTIKENIEPLSNYGIDVILINLSAVEKAHTYLRRKLTSLRLIELNKRFNHHTPLEKHLAKKHIDLVYFLSPSTWARDLEQTNYITTVWDLCHRDDPEFPEVRWNREFERRERIYQTILPRAIAIMVDSEMGKTNVVHRYRIDAERVHIMSFQASVATRSCPEVNLQAKINIRVKYKLDVPYVFYPAQFWAHKNHVYLLNGLSYLEQKYGLRLGAIFSGGDKGNQSYVENYVKMLKLENRVRLVGFVESTEIPELYRQSVALVMPSYFGPTNLPPLEAFGLGVPVLYSDKAGLRDQVGDAALLMNLTDPNSMADHLWNLTNDKSLRDYLVKAGYARLNNLDYIDRNAVLHAVIQNYSWRRLAWS